MCSSDLAYWNFLPPDELDNLLRLYSLVSRKVLKISKTFGIEGKRLLRPEDDYEALRDFVHEYEGEITTREKLHLEWQTLTQDNPALENRLNSLPLRVFSGKRHPSKGARGVFFCYALPALDITHEEAEAGTAEAWNEAVGRAQWYLYDCAQGDILSDPGEIAEAIRSNVETERHCEMTAETLREIRLKIEKHIKNDYLKRAQAPVGVKPTLKAWMELN